METARGRRDGHAQIFFRLAPKAYPNGPAQPITTFCDSMRPAATSRRFAVKHDQSRRSTTTQVHADPTNETVAMGSGT